MKISLQWLSDFVDGPLDAEAIADALTAAGFPIESIETVGADTVLDVEVTSNRGDCLSYVGVAREVAALLGRSMKNPPEPVAASAGLGAAGISVAIESPACFYYTARIIRHVTIRPSPDWLARRLTAIGVRPINNVVDVTNYVMFEMGQPLHAFDAARVGGNSILVRQARAGEKITSIDGHERELAASMLVIADATRPIALAGVMGGRDSEVTDATRDIVLESARFDSMSVRSTARALQMRSESSYRFERGIDPTLADAAGRRAADLILQVAGGTVGAVASAGAGNVAQPVVIELRAEKIRRVLGIDVPLDQAQTILQRLGMNVARSGGGLSVTAPSWRGDIRLEVDLVEEIARLLGYDKIPVREEISIRVSPAAPGKKAIDAIRDVLAGAGYFEAITFSFVSDALADDFTRPGSILARVESVTRKADARLRPSVIPGLLESLARNEKNGAPDATLYEIGSMFVGHGDDSVTENVVVALAGGEDFAEMRGAVELLLARLDKSRSVKVISDARPGFAAGACGRIEWGDRRIGYIGRIAKKTAQKALLRAAPMAAELDVAELLAGAKEVPKLTALPRFPAVVRDVALVVDESLAYEKIANLVTDLALPDLEKIGHGSTYRGKPIPAGKKSVALTLAFRSPTGTLLAEQVEPLVQRVVEAAAARLGAARREG
jgi:phenylalanyl-tRNA synthetase beta chain